MKYFLLIALVLSLSTSSFAQVRYSGRKHTTSHGGHYQSGKGSSHKGGKYKNTRTSNKYGRHKR
ncbi:hypothetical protein [Pedobacter montanisoli]|uniref:Uncharacterized protein n=1 Tax=Pedobacter montanisoli TaxID=2923277 RepID=A0ABS9ZS21_9SPHI|nr:hypothetical protein [Pedobacter montanisoli]MCJ0741390.1 hypothetical protein [Pedobacter montanisoli]